MGKGQDWLNIEVFLELDQAHHLLVTIALYNAYTSDKEIEYLVPGGTVSEDSAKQFHLVLGWTKPAAKDYMSVNADDKTMWLPSYTHLTT